MSPCLVGIEACPSAHYWSRELQALGHTVKLMSPSYVKAYLKRSKNDAGRHQQWGLQLDGNLGSDKGIGEYGGGAHLFWRDPSIGLLGAYLDYAHWNGTDVIDNLTGVNSHISANIGHFAAEGEYCLNRWTLSGLAGLETVSINSGVPLASPPNRFFDDVLVSYYVTDNFKLSAGHIYTLGTNFLTLGGEYGIALGGGRMASLFAKGWIGERVDNGVLAGLRVYFGQRDKSLMDRHRQDDPNHFGIGPGFVGEEEGRLELVCTPHTTPGEFICKPK